MLQKSLRNNFWSGLRKLQVRNLANSFIPYSY